MKIVFSLNTEESNKRDDDLFDDCRIVKVSDDTEPLYRPNSYKLESLSLYKYVKIRSQVGYP